MIVTTASLVTLYFIAYRISRDFWLSLFCVFLAATNVQLWRWNGTFIESSFAFSFVIWAIGFYFFASEDRESNRYRDYFLFGLFLGFGVLLRPELGMLGAIFFASDVLASRSRLFSRYLICGCGFLLLVGGYAIWAKLYFGQALPTTFYAKNASGFIFANPRVAKEFGEVIFSGALGSLLAAAVVIAISLGPSPKSLSKAMRHSFIFWAIPLSGFLFYYLKTHDLQSPARYFLPFMPTLSLIPLSLARDRITTRSALTIMGLASLCQFVSAAYLNATIIEPVLASTWANYISTQFEAADVLNRICEKGQTVLVYYDIGSLSYRLDRKCHIADHGGLATPHVLGLPIAEAVAKSKASFIVETAGTPERIIERHLKESSIRAVPI